MSGLVDVIRAHIPRDGHDDERDKAFTYCTCGGWTGDFFADGEAGPFDEHLAAAVEAWIASQGAQDGSGAAGSVEVAPGDTDSNLRAQDGSLLIKWLMAQQAEQWAAQHPPEAARECDHPGIEHGSFSYTGTCPRCGLCKFIGHGPLCIDCYCQDDRPGATDSGEDARGTE